MSVIFENRLTVVNYEFLRILPKELYSTLISKITSKLVTAFFFFKNQAKFEKL